jgi:RNA polymerase sigma factor (sigma-70 family)
MNSPGSRRLEQIRSAVNAYQSHLIAFATRITGSTDSARDVVQETFLRLCDRDPDTVGDHLAAWLFRVCRNQALDARKKEAPLRPFDELRITPADTTADPHRALERGDEARRVLRALASLPATQQEVLRLRYQSDLSYKEIAEVTGQSIGNVGSVIHVGVRRLRELLQATAGTDERNGAGGRTNA